jgi:hypothetical protein
MNRAPFDVKIQYSVGCSRCNREPVIEFAWWFARTEFPLPSLPAGWVSLDGAVICDKHEIHVVNRVAKAMA